MGSAYEILSAFVAEISEIALRDKSVDVTTSNHSLEPNGRQLRQLLRELFRVTIEKVILFEPCYEINSEEGKKRMLEMGYVTNIGGIAEGLGGKIIETLPIKNVKNPLNPTVCYVITPPQKEASTLVKVMLPFRQMTSVFSRFQAQTSGGDQGRFLLRLRSGSVFPGLEGDTYFEIRRIDFV
jgi:hypothetical protein